MRRVNHVQTPGVRYRAKYATSNPIQKNPTGPMRSPGRPWVLEAASIKGTASPIVWFRQSRKVVSSPDGSGVFVALGSLLSAALLLYPSSVRATLLAR